MKLLCWQAERFSWRSHSKTLEDVPEQRVEERVDEAVVVFMHIEAGDQGDEARARAFKRTLKHIKWLANKRDLKHIVLHSFAHLGGENAEPAFAKGFMDELDQRLVGTGYRVWQTPFGYFCAWDLAVYGDSLAKVWKQI